MTNEGTAADVGRRPSFEHKVIVRYFERPSNYWEGETFPMEKLPLLHGKIVEKYSSDVTFLPPQLPQGAENCGSFIDHADIRPLLQRVHTETFLSRLSLYASASRSAAGTNMAADKRRRLAALARAEFETGLDDAVLNNEIRDLLGTVSACSDALSNGRLGFNIGGGNHHAFADYGHGYCILNDVTCAASWVLSQGSPACLADVFASRSTGACPASHWRILILDLDVHQGDGVASLLGPTNPEHSVAAHPWGKTPEDLERTVPWWSELQSRKASQQNAADDAVIRRTPAGFSIHETAGQKAAVMVVSMHQEDNFPHIKMPSHIDVGLDDGIDDKVYLAKLETALHEIERIRDSSASTGEAAEQSKLFDLCIYVAGADPYMKDPLGGINLTLDGLRRRDRMVAGFGKKHNIPMAIVLAGGYASAEEVAQIHFGTFEEMVNVLYS